MTTTLTPPTVSASNAGSTPGLPRQRTTSPEPGTSQPIQFPRIAGRDVHLRDLTISYQRGNQTVTPVQSFNLFAKAEQVTALVGRSGSGKTSILSCIGAMLTPQSGAVWLGGIEVTALQGSALDSFRRSHVGVIHQAYNLLASLSVLENVCVPLRLAGVSRAVAAERSEALLNEVGMDPYLRHKPGQLSGGQQQRVAVARALATNPTLILADEPTAHLDGSSVDEVSELLRAIAVSGRTVIMATHDDRLLNSADQLVHL
jgi:putative ABC transport system ATP-binding protein